MDLGYPYEETLATNRTDLLMCSYISSNHNLNVTNGKCSDFTFVCRTNLWSFLSCDLFDVG